MWQSQGSVLLGYPVIANISYRQGARKIIFHQGRSKTVYGRGNGNHTKEVLNGIMLLFKSVELFYKISEVTISEILYI